MMNKTYNTNLNEAEALSLFKSNLALLGESVDSVAKYVPKTETSSAMVVVESKSFADDEAEYNKHLSSDYVSSTNIRHALRVLHRHVGQKVDDASIDRGGAHDAPGTHDSPMYDLSKNGSYPEDLYKGRGHEYAYDRHSMKGLSHAYDVEGKPHADVKVYRAVHKDSPSKINPGDWVTTVRGYAQEHGVSNLGGNHKIVSKTVTARELYNDGNSLTEYGYHPQSTNFPRIDKAKRGIPQLKFADKIASITKRFSPYHGMSNYPKHNLNESKSFAQLRASLKEVYDLPEIEKKQDVGNINKHAVSLLATGKNSSGEQYKTTKIGPITKSGHQISYFYPKPDKDALYPDTQRFIIAHKEGETVPHVVIKADAEVPGKPVFKIAALSKTPESDGIKAHEVYNHLLQHGPNGTTLVSTAQSKGGKAVWQKLAKTNGVSVHGFDPQTNEVYNTDEHLDSDYDYETHADPTDKESHVGGENNEVLNRWLVAHKKLDESMDKGAFHRYLGKSESEPITNADIEQGLASDDEHVRKMAQFAKNMQNISEEFTSTSFMRLREMTMLLDKESVPGGVS